MNLTTALRLRSAARVAIAGGGGKTTTMFLLARELAAPVIVAATAHLAIEQTALADQHFAVEDSTTFEERSLAGITLFTGPSNNAGKTIGLTAAAMQRVLDLANHHHVPLLIEADGAQGLPLKAPAEHEPPIPEFVDTVIYVAGLSGLGQPLDAAHVHRPERFARLSGLSLGDAITPDAIVQVLCDPSGGLKNVPSTARRIAVLNQADTPELQAQAQAIARHLLPTWAYHSVVSAALKQQQVYAVHEPAAGIILAAGASTRMHQPKPLLLWRGEPFIRHVAHTA
ncbi:MAG: putative selenium-dependent hydroxylase accessory protein YqeC, partial [Chloroflexi bacterium]|nr:putative selenium-dependent hydroxylase accessory protein YqeC [Chloroflexota bacterium]